MRNEINAYIDSLRNKGLRPRSLAHYEYVLSSLHAFLLGYANDVTGDMPAGAVTIDALNAYSAKHRSEGLSSNARNNYYTIVRSFFSFLHDAGLIGTNPSVTLSPVKQDERDTDDDALDEPGGTDAKYTSGDIQTLFEAMNRSAPTHNAIRDRAILSLFIASGLRAFEVCSLNVSDFAGIKKGTVRCAKKGSNRKSPVTIGSFCVPYIEKYLFLRGKCEPDEPLFASQKRNPHTGKPNRLTPNALWKSFATKQRKAETKTGLHCFRSASLTAVNKEAGIAAARDFARHKRAVTTADHYAKSTADERREAIDSSDIANIFRR